MILYKNNCDHTQVSYEHKIYYEFYNKTSMICEIEFIIFVLNKYNFVTNFSYLNIHELVCYFRILYDFCILFYTKGNFIV
jgi:hypothetical protein